MQSEKLKPFDWQESIDSMPEGKFKEREQRLYDLNQKIEVGTDPSKLALKIISMYEIYKDIHGDEIAPLNHSELAAAVLKPFVSEKTRWIVEQHGLFQAYYYNHYYGKDRNLRDKFIGHEFYKDTINFCEKWDQASFDPNYDTIPLKDFVPLVQKIFNREPYRNL